MTVAIVVLLAVVAIELGVLLWALARPLFALARIGEAGAEITEALGTFVARLTESPPLEELRSNLDNVRTRRARDE